MLLANTSIEEQLIDVLRSIEENLGSLIAAQARAADSRSEEKETSRLLTTLCVKFDLMTTTINNFTLQQQAFESRQRDLESKVTRIMAYGGAGITIVTMIVHYLGGK